eukprot:CAMPEP_0170518954 /NCGR_PEP_ID=MMETSP0209-20121228/4529_1 /TAXON_ID=665100 ORGANISM="Litonotus pictus, Strain P1" /NCGR_SAMPLE_ID=MMETSP0209 /ASSEMBLY_ACC=CAM_ASM_000301 /LENGTH=169 /DNA_ID=CAMNT_0010804707 /DNA_START=29 /DNA_END=538 /DNA_ORIENTATION=-
MVEDEETSSSTVSTGLLQFKKEVGDLESSMIPQGKLYLNKNDLRSFKVDYTPDKDSFWYPGVYSFTFTIPDNYSITPPKVSCSTKIYHPNIDFQGNVCLNILKEDWKPTLNMAAVVASVYFLFYDPNPKDPLNHQAAELMRDNKDGFVANVKKTLKGGQVFGESFPKFI